jgi:secondary thiamine-phosphate synthase enzyme
MHDTISIRTTGQGLYEFTPAILRFLSDAPVRDGLLTLFCQHTSRCWCRRMPDPDVQADLKAFFRRLAPPANDPSMSYLEHRTEGPDDMPAHIKAALTQTSLSIPVIEGRLALGTWQGIYLFEHRDAPHTRRIVAHLLETD